MIAGPSLLLADEPTGNVDDAMADRLMRLFEEMNRLGTTLVLATHNEALVARRAASAAASRRRASSLREPARARPRAMTQQPPSTFRSTATARAGSCPG